ncbi:ABC transporter substrate-binding protein [Paenibacillus sp. J2TS4]|uniref:ABC transporter substrate-binding protein n=1 Tax=Paenibacillus sp. J2TS4 TaxID=2807194 RepID=UPI001B07AD31|nr:ABC transporter substrate-binding protein [Paenibacillus sp. J2TS4]GIP33227.1 ABC transporter substrate-binding protein [Paenibacillus sp. J2TS4]
MKMKKTLQTVAVAALAATSIVGCSSGQNGGGASAPNTTPAPAATPAPEDQTPVTIQYWHAHAEGQIEGLNFMIKEFQDKYPWITVEPVYQGAYGDLHKKLMAAVAAKEVPAVTNVEVASLPTFGEGGIFMDLGPFIQRDQLDTDDFAQGMFQAYSYEGKQYGFPLIVSANVFIYNKTMFDELGVTPPQTWDEIVPFSEKVTQKEGNNVTRYAFSVPGWDAWYAETWIRNGGGTPLTEDLKSGLDKEESLRMIRSFKEWMDKGYMHMGYGKGASADMRQMFFDGKVGMVHHTSGQVKWYVENSDFEIGVSFPPGDAKHISQIGGAGIAIMDMAKDIEKEAAWKFVQFMTSSEYNVRWADYSGYLPTRKSAINSDEGKEYFDKRPQYKAILDNIDNVVARPQYPPYPESVKYITEALGKIVLENLDVEAAFKEAAEKMNEVLEDY